MVKQKVVLKLSMENAKKRAKAMQCAVGCLGVVSASHEGDKMTVVGEGIDSVALTRLLRKKMGYVELMMVTAVEEEKTDEKKLPVEPDAPSNNQTLILTQPPCYCVEFREPSYDQINCSIM